MFSFPEKMTGLPDFFAEKSIKFQVSRIVYNTLNHFTGQSCKQCYIDTSVTAKSFTIPGEHLPFLRAVYTLFFYKKVVYKKV